MITYKIYHTSNALPKSWDCLNHNDIFLKQQFLKALENSCPNNVTPYYIGVFKAEKLVAIAIVQRVEMYLDDIFRNTNDNYLIRKSKQVISKIVRGNALIVGNIMHTGQHGLYFNRHEIEYTQFLNEVFKALKSIAQQIKNTNKKNVRIIAFKDYFKADAIHKYGHVFKREKLYKVQVQPNMVFTIPEVWKTKQDYSSALSKKYRDRYKSALKKGKVIEKKELDLNELIKLKPQIFQLYKNVSDNARVNSFILNSCHFIDLKTALKDNFKVFGYFINQELVGFFSLIINERKLETYFLGYNNSLQKKHQMYLNMLYDMAVFGIENNFNTIIYARTAMEIKSSIGAKAKAMDVYMKHTNTFPSNMLLRFIVKYLNPARDWVERHPFK
ncbi:hypothetical protein [Lacinutrix sp. 5H-3-7-4]|uniref:hypothetical protein n=1 Tax=Lacinutrix sp. (strain 5H-3-7-4) TaxID=983544 RepID=UPI00020A372C|nr:hypothetical protein [Lacinutrix sp. 5H-3-7-4]AEH00839.1 hypothetical protein Lacal_0991 [Lacinutrix sp. 5H-3-7-4]